VVGEQDPGRVQGPSHRQHGELGYGLVLAQIGQVDERGRGRGQGECDGRSSAHERSLDDDEPTHQPVAIISIDLSLDDAPEAHCQALAARP
jgi:hypothetical protein